MIDTSGMVSKGGYGRQGFICEQFYDRDTKRSVCIARTGTLEGDVTDVSPGTRVTYYDENDKTIRSYWSDAHFRVTGPAGAIYAVFEDARPR